DYYCALYMGGGIWVF
nr:immunoglobulin light chain junction region [Macaca mulatta]MOW57587.1 immunoglobulin light chain junction region [Macaca mulatta]MOW57666.1 immunoglobulin light chain junction region [Macaca mulatta]MOW59239.1 immunoglobulin light chain junction region [Macaca mulatta]MOW59770.1 immunoglobulin light chain junction region [Macaca mulatta]